nr:hypothetical protein [Tanacetum cinerariifolium]
ESKTVKPVAGIEPVTYFEIICNLDMCLCISALAHIGSELTFDTFTLVSWLIMRLMLMLSMGPTCANRLGLEFCVFACAINC